MTGKRFKIFEHGGDDYLLDMEYALGYDDPNVDYIEFLGQAMTTKECCKELNHLHEENEQLKKELKQEKYLHKQTTKELSEYKDFMGLG